uniref:cytochrome b n=1 Tax=Parachordodes pustulosus TaxID=3049253 RepID=UPI002E7736BC|nr:cytochrome b [Parachordodes pustulosus]WQH58899.1 cytochrome b [Parachordodes pustulosus]
MMKKISLRKSSYFNFLNNFIIDLPTPMNLSFWWNFGSILGLLLSIQIITGIFLSMSYSSSHMLSFLSIVSLEINNWEGFSLRSAHATGASFMFICLFLHMYRGLYFSSFSMNKTTWSSGVTIFLLTMIIAFLGYVLPWGQMSYWAATVITNMLSAVPIIGKNLVLWVWGGFSVGAPTLNRFYTFHFLFPMILILLVLLHLIFLHNKGSNNPLGVPSSMNKITFHSMFSFKDIFGFILPLFFMIFFMTNYPDFFSDVANFIEANPLSTPAHIMPEWYFLFAYGILRSVPNKLGGVIAMIMSIVIMYFLVISKNQILLNLMKKITVNLISSTFLILSFIGSQLVEQPFIITGQIFSIFYFFLFILLVFL